MWILAAYHITIGFIKYKRGKTSTSTNVTEYTNESVCYAFVLWDKVEDQLVDVGEFELLKNFNITSSEDQGKLWLWNLHSWQLGSHGLMDSWTHGHGSI